MTIVYPSWPPLLDNCVLWDDPEQLYILGTNIITAGKAGFPLILENFLSLLAVEFRKLGTYDNILSLIKKRIMLYPELESIVLAEIIVA